MKSEFLYFFACLLFFLLVANFRRSLCSDIMHFTWPWLRLHVTTNWELLCWNWLWICLPFPIFLSQNISQLKCCLSIQSNRQWVRMLSLLLPWEEPTCPTNLQPRCVLLLKQMWMLVSFLYIIMNYSHAFSVFLLINLIAIESAYTDSPLYFEVVLKRKFHSDNPCLMCVDRRSRSWYFRISTSKHRHVLGSWNSDRWPVQEDHQ